MGVWPISCRWHYLLLMLFVLVHTNAEAIVDIATLTGACMIALGDGMCALYSSTDDVAAAVQAAAKAAGTLGHGGLVGWDIAGLQAPELSCGCDMA